MGRRSMSQDTKGPQEDDQNLKTSTSKLGDKFAFGGSILSFFSVRESYNEQGHNQYSGLPSYALSSHINSTICCSVKK